MSLEIFANLYPNIFPYCDCITWFKNTLPAIMVFLSPAITNYDVEKFMQRILLTNG